MSPLNKTQQNQFSASVLYWFKHYGRHNLPWQHNTTAYRVWLSEIMLQQTQVVTVIDYYQRFIERFPDLNSLATADLDDVLVLWAGLGYYARARNLHKTAIIVNTEFHGEFPKDLELMQTLPGIGKSTASAILTFAYGQSHAILDGNVKRVLARHFEVEGWSGTTKTLNHLWHLTETLTPKDNTAEFNQAMMDIGATVCTRSKPKCAMCCLKETCLAFKNDTWTKYPMSKPKKKNPIRQAYFVLLSHQDGLYLTQRPPTGIWGGLWCLPEFNTLNDAYFWVNQFGNKDFTAVVNEDVLLHKFSHYDLRMHLLTVETKHFLNILNEGNIKNIAKNQIHEIGLPTPIKKILNKI